ncbi:MAG: Proteasome subunit beta type-4 [Watsoniomyces obsoletus]|nr:MAG: Proteasome subunit beta type-4 [Watsoniomyces obsoletus]
MTKRHAEESLEEAVSTASPASKKPRMERNLNGEGAPPNGDTSVLPLHTRSNGDAQHRAASTLQKVDETQQEEPDEDEVDTSLEEHSALTSHKRQEVPTEGYTDLYLDTINRSLLDFDFEKLCSVTLSNINVYACLVCGKYYQGRGSKSHAYFHALDVGHHVFVNMETKRVYVLPEGYEVTSKSLEDIKFVVDPRYTKEEVAKLDSEPRSSWDLGGKKYIPGFVGLNNIKENDYLNVVVHALAHVPPLRNFFMLEDLSSRPQLAQRFSILVRKIWNPRAFKSHVSPHELLQEVSLRSNKRFNLIEQSDPVDFLSWFLNHLHLALGGSKTKPGTSIIQKVFQGKLKVESQQITAKADAGDRLRFEEAAEVKVEVNRFLMLTLDLPPAPLFQDEHDRNIIPQVPLSNILSKYDGIRSQEHLAHRRRYRLLHPLPPYLIFHIKRFSRNKFVTERNPTIVTFPVRSLDMAPYVEPSPADHSPGEPIWYDLVANITHEAIRSRDDSVEGETPKKVWRVQLRDKAREEWIQVQDLFVEEVRKEILFLGESYVQVWERRRGSKKRI